MLLAFDIRAGCWKLECHAIPDIKTFTILDSTINFDFSAVGE